jgi:hypothetical protein
MATMSVSFTATGNGGAIAIKRGEKFTYEVSGTFVGTWVLESSESLGSWTQVATGTAAGSGTVEVASAGSGELHYRFRCSAFTSGTIVTEIQEVANVFSDVVDTSGNQVFEVNEDAAVFHKSAQTEVTGLGSVPAAVSSTCSVIHYGCGPYIKSVFTLESLPVTVTSVTTGNAVGGTQIFDFPAGYIRHFGSTADLSIAVTDEDDYTDGTPEGDVGLGTVAPANADALGTDATDDDFATATAFTLSAHAGAVDLPPEAAANFDGTSTAKNLFLNALVDAADFDNDAADDMLFSGTITVCWMNLGDY